VGSDDAAIAMNKLGELAKESGLVFADFVELWTEDTGYQLRLASAALAAGDLRAAARLVRRASAASGMCGVTGLADELRMVEDLAAEGRISDALEALANARVRFAAISAALRANRRPAPNGPSAAAPRG